MVSNEAKHMDETKYMELLTKAKRRLEDIKGLQSKGLICRDGDFVPSVHYPPITKYPLSTEEELFNGYTIPQDGLVDIYVHFPFCEQRCIFCHYPGKLGEQWEEKNRYLTALEKEMDIYMDRLAVDKLRPRSILVGGGTPTFLTPEQLKRFLDFFVRRVDLSKCRQFNYDVDPRTLVGEIGMERLKIMKEYGVNRLTIGVQSLDDKVLKIMNRSHDVKTAIESIDNAKKFGYQVNIEFIFGHPGETIENWIEVMEKAVTLPVDEIQLYRLKVKAYGDLQGSILKVREKDSSLIPSFEDTMIMKQIAIDILSEHGYHENLRRVYTKDRKNFSHYAYNQCCMLYDQIGLGLTAFSSLRDRFGLNTQSFDEYYAAIDGGRLPVNRGYIRDKEQQLRWTIVLPLKNRDIRKADFNKITGISFDNIFGKKVERLKRYGLLEEDEGRARLTDLGAFVADEVVEQFNSNEFIPFPRDSYAEGPLNPYLDNTSQDASSELEIWEQRKNNTSVEVTYENKFVEPTHENKWGNNNWDIRHISDQQLLRLLTAEGKLQQELFEQARAVRQQYFGSSIKLRGVIELSNICNKNCDYCAMRCSNVQHRYQLDAETVLAAARDITSAGIKTIMLQAGQNPKGDCIVEEVLPVITKELGAEVILCIGERDKEAYNRFAKLGAGSFILKFETSHGKEYERIAHGNLAKRIECMKWIKEAGMKIGTGNIIGLPEQTLKQLIEDIKLALSLKPDFVSTAPFIPNEGTPFQDYPVGDINLALNTMAIWRMALKGALIPSVSALEIVKPGGQLMGLNAGANVMTVNFTPQIYRSNYEIYSKDRFIVSLNHAINTAKKAELHLID